MEIKLKKIPSSDLLKLYGLILEELKERELIRSMNNPVADLSEYLVANAFNMILASNSNEGYDAIDENGIKYQIKGRRISSKGSRQLGVIRNLLVKDFDYLIGVIFNSDFSILEAYKIPHHLIEKYARYNKHQNGHILLLKEKILTDTEVTDITNEIKACFNKLECKDQKLKTIDELT